MLYSEYAQGERCCSRFTIERNLKGFYSGEEDRDASHFSAFVSRELRTVARNFMLPRSTLQSTTISTSLPCHKHLLALSNNPLCLLPFCCLYQAAIVPFPRGVWSAPEREHNEQRHRHRQSTWCLGGCPRRRCRWRSYSDDILHVRSFGCSNVTELGGK